MMKKPLILDSKNSKIWVNVNGRRHLCIWDVTGVDQGPQHVKSFKAGKKIGLVWNGEEIQGQW
jgi:hypothetical protein